MDDELCSLFDKEDFVYLFDSVTKIGGELRSYSDMHTSTSDGVTAYTAKLDFENITADLTISFRNMKICSFIRNVYFKETFELSRDGGIMEKYFVLESDGCSLNAVYTYANDDEPHPAVLLIAGSGPSDYNETVGILTPFEETAIGLAKNGVNSLRVDKRTLNYSAELDKKAGIEEEYLIDCASALDFLKKQNISGLYLIGHSLGGQIAAEIASNDSDINGIILWNSSARHLADIACSQYTAIDPSNGATYTAYAEAAKNAAESNAKGDYYYGASDYYWASYNQLDTAKNIADADIRTLIVNSKYDRQTSDEDITLWNTLFYGNGNAAIRVFNDLSHIGYKIDTAEPYAVYRQTEFPEEVITAFAEFIKGD